MNGKGSLSQWQTEFDDLLRGFSGAFIFGVPLLYTMEVWWRGNHTTPARMMTALAITYVSLVFVNRGSGFREQCTNKWSRNLSDSAEALAIGIVAATLSLWLIGAMGVSSSLETLMGRIIMETIPFSLGVGLSGYLLKMDEAGDEDSEHEGDDEQQDSGKKLPGTIADIGATALGATVIAFSIAPTDEVPMISARLSSAWLLIFIAASLVLSYIIVFEASFTSQKARKEQRGIFQHPVGETIASYLISLTMAAGMLWLFQSLSPSDPLEKWVSYIIVLGFPATIGGAAGRLAI
jgi:putative integral membrane protein (TIGR02587 family)